MDCAACGTTGELVYACERCGDLYCATHHAHRYHDCEPELEPEPESQEWPSLEWPSPGWVSGSDLAPESVSDDASAEPQEWPSLASKLASGSTSADAGEEQPGEARGSAADVKQKPEQTGGPEPSSPTARTGQTPEAAVERPRAQLYPQEVEVAESTNRSVPPEADRPGYGPEPFSAEPVGPARTIPEWFRRQTYFSLTVKVGLLATFCNLLAFSLIGAAMVVPLG